MLGKIIESPIGPAVVVADNICILVSKDPHIFNGVLTPLDTWWILPKAISLSSIEEYKELDLVDVSLFKDSLYCGLIISHTLENYN